MRQDDGLIESRYSCSYFVFYLQLFALCRNITTWATFLGWSAV